MKTQYALINKLRRSDVFLWNLPETIRIPAQEGHSTDEVVRPLADASVDDLAFAIQGLAVESRAHQRRLEALRDLYELARKRGALGVTTVSAAFADLCSEGGQK